MFTNRIKLFFAALAVAFGFAIAPASATVEGTFTNQNISITGDWKIVEEDGKKYIELSENFRTRSGPDLKIFLSPKAAEDVTGRNATQGSVLVAQLDSNRGGQRYEIPEGVNLANFGSVVIHCERFSKLWGAGDIVKS